MKLSSEPDLYHRVDSKLLHSFAIVLKGIEEGVTYEPFTSLVTQVSRFIWLHVKYKENTHESVYERGEYLVHKSRRNARIYRSSYSQNFVLDPTWGDGNQHCDPCPRTKESP